MPRTVAWVVRVVAILPLLVLIGYLLIAPGDSPVRFGYRFFIPIAGLLALAVWQLTKSPSAPEPEDRSSTEQPGT